MATTSFQTPTADELLAIAARHSCAQVLRAPRPLFATPGFHFALDHAGRVADRPLRFLTRADLQTAPSAILERLRARLEPGPAATALAVALDQRGDLHADPQQVPDFLLVYVALAADDRRAVIARRVVAVHPEGRSRAALLEREVLAFDQRFERGRDVAAPSPAALH